MSKTNTKNKREIRVLCGKAFPVIFASLLIIPFLSSCKKKYIPKPYGYYRVYLPEHEYRSIDTLNLPYRFDLSGIAKLESRNSESEMYWIDIVYPSLNAKIHGSYKRVKNDIFELSEDTREFVYAHTGRAEGISESAFENPEKSVYGILYDLKGNVASPLQFVLTDSTKHFFRGAVYFNNNPNKDSIAPMLNYVREDVIQLVESFEWVR